MKQRCYNTKHKYFSCYGARGIKVCPEWINDFEAFQRWAILNGYEEGLTLERKDINGDYAPNNCCFDTIRQQTYHRRNTLFIYYQNEKISVAEMVYELGLDYYQVTRFLKEKVNNQKDDRKEVSHVD
jgi:hypothetical protein